jgi:hypothetical protein
MDRRHNVNKRMTQMKHATNYQQMLFKSVLKMLRRCMLILYLRNKFLFVLRASILVLFIMYLHKFLLTINAIFYTKNIIRNHFVVGSIFGLK